VLGQYKYCTCTLFFSQAKSDRKLDDAIAS
jgi:hypothetical protein